MEERGNTFGRGVDLSCVKSFDWFCAGERGERIGIEIEVDNRGMRFFQTIFTMAVHAIDGTCSVIEDEGGGEKI